MKRYLTGIYLFYFILNASFAQIQIGQDIDGFPYDQCGWSVSISNNGNKIAVGSPYNDNGGTDAGMVRIFD